MTKRQLDLKLGPILGQITPATDSCPLWKRKWTNTHHTRCVMCHAQVVGGSEVSKYKIGRFFGRQNAGASNHGTLLMKYLGQQCKIGAKKPHQ